MKGIYPREPRNKKKASKSSTPSTTFYYTKDIQYLLHEPLLDKFREHKALSKKIARSLGRGEVGDAARLEKTGSSKISLDHIIKERYSTFVDALRDLDDALSMLFLFANLPSTSTVPPKTIALCQRLCLEFEHYLITTHSLRKSFLSIKGIYYQATIQGQDILWLVPYRFVQRVTGDVDFRIMGTFVEFYTTLLGFVNFRLYTSIGLVYPPKFDASSDEKGGELGAFTLEGRGVTAAQPQLEAPQPAENGTVNGATGAADIQAQVDSLGDLPEPEEEQPKTQDEIGEEVNDAIDKFETTDPDADVLPQPQSSSAEASNLFAPYTFYLSRETPRQPLEFLLRSFGCKRIGWDTVLGDGAFTHNEADTTITHQVVDRPSLPQDALPALPDTDGSPDAVATQSIRPGSRIPGRTYIQPQWVWDCINQGKLLRPDLYAPGATLPPHLSPWVKPTKGAYDPSAPLAEQEREGEAEEAMEAEAEEQEEEDMSAEEHEEEPAVNGTKALTTTDESAVNGGMDIAGTDDDDDNDQDNDADKDDEFTGFDSAPSADEDEAETLRTQHQRDLEAEASGLPFSGDHNGAKNATGNASIATKKKGDEARKKAARKRREEEEELERQKMMMSRKKRKVLDKMLFSNRKKDEEAERLRGKRRRIEKGRGEGSGEGGLV